MAHKLTVRFVATAKPGNYNDTQCPTLIFRVTKAGTRQWVQKLQIDGKQRMVGLGGYPLFSLGEAREAATENRKIARRGGDPRWRISRVPTFGSIFEETLAKTKLSERTAKQRWAMYRARIEPKLGRLRVDQIEPRDVLAVLEPIWTDKPETARKVRQWIAKTIDRAAGLSYRSGENPAGSVLDTFLPKQNGMTKHHRAVPYTDVAEAIGKIDATDAWWATKAAFQFLILTAARSGEVRGACWGEINFDAAVWTVPGDRTKTRRSHRVPLAPHALDILSTAREYADGSDFIFPSVRGKAMSDSTLSKLVREAGIDGVPHGFRSSFRDWCADNGVEGALSEAALAHSIKNKTEAAYARSDLLERRRSLMQDWADYIAR